MSLYITGDIHRTTDISKLLSENFKISRSLTKDDILVVLGDWGAIWYGDERDNQILNWWEEQPWTTFVVLGNHCNYDAIEKLPIVEKFGSPARKVSNSVYIALSGNIYTLCGKRCLTINGAESIDKALRTEGLTWWPQEAITIEDCKRALSNISNQTPDYIFSHTGGSEVVKNLGFNAYNSDLLLDKILAAAPSASHFCGHYHGDKIVNERSRIVYDDIIMLGD